MVDTVVTITVSDPAHLVMNPAATHVTIPEGTTYPVTFVPSQSYQVRVVDSNAYDSGWTSGVLVRNMTPPTDLATLTVTVAVQPIPVPIKSSSTVTLARYYAGEVIPSDGTASDTFFDDDFIGGLVNEAGGNVFRAVARMWMMKAAEYARLIDLDEAGSIRKLTQRYKQAKEMVENFTRAADIADEAAAGTVRLAARPVNLRGTRHPGWRVDGPWFEHGWAVVAEFWSITDLLPPLTRKVDKVAPL